MKILLVDDEPLVLKALEITVAKVAPEATLFPFTKAKEAINFARENPIDIAFLDINMRVVDGIGMAKELQKMQPRINIVFCTGYSEYAMDAHELYCSGYLLKPVLEDNVREVLHHLRYPIEEEKKSNVYIQCFGNFEVYYKGEPIAFEYSRTKELLAYLVDRYGANCSTRELLAVLFEDDMKMSYFQRLRRDLIKTFEDLGETDIIQSAKGTIRINCDSVECDYFAYRQGKAAQNYNVEEYMAQYSFAESTFGINHKTWESENDADE